MEFVRSQHGSNSKNVTQRLEQEAARMTNKDAALFVPSGTMSNLVALMAHAKLNCSSPHAPHQQPEVIVGNLSHIHQWEAGGLSSIGRIYSRQVATDASSGQLSVNDIKRNICNNTSDSHRAVTAAVALENTHGDCGGKVLPVAYIEAVKGMLRSIGPSAASNTTTPVALHCDGARLWNAAHYSSSSSSCPFQSLQALTEHFDSISLCLSKGLGAPAGSVLVGESKFVEEARGIAASIGGGISSTSDRVVDGDDAYASIAAAGLYAIQHNFERMRHDNDNAVRLARGMREAGFVVQPVETNIVICNVTNGKQGRSSEFVRLLKQRCGVSCLEMDETSIRFVLNMHVSREGVEEFCKMLKKDDVLRGYC